MKKESTRPLLVGIVEYWRAREQQALRILNNTGAVPELLQLQADWHLASRELASAETILWLADRQWLREEGRD